MAAYIRILRWLHVAGLVALLSSCKQPSDADAGARQPAKDTVVAPAQKLTDLFEEYWLHHARQQPPMAAAFDVHRFDDQWPNFLSAAERARTLAFNERLLADLQRLSLGDLQARQRMHAAVLAHEATLAVEGSRYPSELLPVLNLPLQVAALVPGENGIPPTLEEHEAWLGRARQLPALFDQMTANLRRGMEQGITHPRLLLRGVVPGLGELLPEDPSDSVFLKPLVELAGDIDAADQDKLRAAYLEVTVQGILPSIRRLRDFLRDEYRARESVGMSQLPGGLAWYTFNLRQLAPDLEPERLHVTGLAEVARIRSELRAVAGRLKVPGDLRALFNTMKTAPRYGFESEEEMLEAYRATQQVVITALPRSFSSSITAVLQKYRLELAPMDEELAGRADNSAYDIPSLDATKAAVLYLNTGNPSSSRRWMIDQTVLHEAIPGHHLQYAAGLTPQLPRFREFEVAHFSFNVFEFPSGEAFREGWAHYSEGLGRELGLYQSPAAEFGYLQSDLLSSIRVVVDTGLHAMGWSVETAVQYIVANATVETTTAQAAVRECIAIPARAMREKIGGQTIIALRERARAALGDAFDIREFHEQVLSDGSLPLEVLADKIDRWLAKPR